ncbi:unnamed protein product [Hymenolepis diminuta]|uniref:Clathrin light chain n=1 Tax=Hymenolepis diminuta TaxID=6216 RepID=A0A158QF64_HYMDI|nr:unnamed protein product [Hymenolepis diminuta]
MAEYGVSEFLARERDDLGDLAGDIPGGNGGGSDLDEDSKRDNSYVIEPEETEHHRSSTSAPSMAESEEAAEKNVNGRDESKTSSPIQSTHESAYMESWKANFEADIKARDEKEALKKAELEATAKKACFTLILFIHYFYSPHQELETWYAHYRKQMALRSADNRAEAPRDASGKAYEGFSGTAPTVRDTAVWESVCGMCDLTSKNTKSTHDLSRMRSLLLNLKTSSSH